MLGGLIGGLGSLLGGWMSGKNAEEQQNRNIELQKEFAQHGIQWRVEDAKRAGIHPLYALGGSTPSYTPSAIVGGDMGISSAAAQMGQDVSRSINATRTQEQRLTAAADTAQKLQLENMGLQNQLLSSQIAKINASINPPMPAATDNWLIGGQSGSGLIKESPMKRTTVDPAAPYQEPGAIPDVGYARTSSGGYTPIPSSDVKERIEDNMIQEFAWALRNNVIPSLGSPIRAGMTPPFPAPAGSEWLFNPFKQEYQLYDGKNWDATVQKFGGWIKYLTGGR